MRKFTITLTMMNALKKINPQKTRIDRLIVDRGLVKSRVNAQALIMAGKVFVDAIRVDKAGKEVNSQSDIVIKEGLPYVSRGGVKLKGALDDFNINVEGLVAMDVGSSTGGFTDCLLKKGVKRVYAVDVGKGLMDAGLIKDERVHLVEGRNVRYLKEEDVGEKIDLIVTDVSFISLKKVIPNLKGFLKPSGKMLCLVKPQFEVGKGEVGRGGIVRDPEKHRRVLEELKDFSRHEGFSVEGVMESPILGAKGNREFWLYLKRH